MNKPLYIVKAVANDEECIPVAGFSKTFDSYMSALDHFHDLCNRNGIEPTQWKQQAFHMLAQSEQHTIELIVIDF